MSVAARKPSTPKVAVDAKPDAPVLPSGVAMQVDAGGYLYDPWFRELIQGRVGASMDAATLLDTETVRAVAICGKVLHASFEESLNKIGLTFQQYRTMMCIVSRGKDGTQLHPIANWLGVSPRNVTALVDALEGQGLAERVDDPTDRRAVIARLTPAGREKAATAQRLNGADLKRVMGILSADEKLQLRHLTLKLLAAAAGTAITKRSKENG